MMKLYKMHLPDTSAETFVKYTKLLISSKRFPKLSDGCLTVRKFQDHCPTTVHPWLHWYDGGSINYVYFGHEEDYNGKGWELFTLFDKEPLGEL